MTQPYGETGEALRPDWVFSPDPTDAADLQLKITEITPEDRLAELAAELPLPDSVKAAHHPSTLGLFDIGCPTHDEDHQTATIKCRVAALESLSTLTHYAYGGSSRTFGRLHVRETRRPESYGTYQAPPELGSYVQAMNDSKTLGLASSSAMAAALLPIQFLYYDESPPVSDTLPQLGFVPSDVADIYPDGPPEKVEFLVFAEQLRRVRGADLSQETLDERFAAFTGMLNGALSTAILAELSLLSMISTQSNRSANKLAKEHKDDVLSDDIRAKLGIMTTIKDYATNLQNASGGRRRNGQRQNNRQWIAAQAVAGHTESLAQNTEEFLWFFRNVYTTLAERAGHGFELPPLLQDEVESEPVVVPVIRAAQTAVAQAVVVEAPPEAATEPEPTIDTETAEHINGLRELLTEQVASHNKPWILSKKLSKDLELDALQDLLRQGASVRRSRIITGIGNWTLPHLSPVETTLLVGTLVRLDTLVRTKSREQALAALDTATAERAAIIASIEELTTYAAENNHPSYSRPTHPVDANQTLQYVADNWHVFSDILDTLGPDPQERPRFTYNIWRLLPEPQAHSPYTQTLSALRTA